MYFWNYRLWKTWLEPSLKNAVSELPLRVNMFKGHKNLWKQYDNTYITFLHHSEKQSFAKYLL